MVVFRYDRSFEGLLTCVFDAYSRREFPDALIGPGEVAPMFAGSVCDIVTDSERAGRVWRAFTAKLPGRVCNMVVHAWLSETPGSGRLIFEYMRKVIDSGYRAWDDFTDPGSVELRRLAQDVAHEGEHIRQFVRFQKAADGSYFAPIEPRYNALPLSVDYFTQRFGDQRWLVYDVRRGYGYYYDMERVRELSLDDDARIRDGKLPDEMLDPDERQFQQMWRSYFKSLAIRERINPRLQRQHMPVRFWKFLTEKQDEQI